VRRKIMKEHPYLQQLCEAFDRSGSVLCFGMDPVADRMKIDTSRNLGDEIVRYFSSILGAISNRISAVKPNVAYYLQYGSEGLQALSKLAQAAKKLGLPVIIDLKAGDIGRTSAAYARFVFEVIGGDAVTLNPYMGFDAIEPFTGYKDRGFYILALTSNSGSRDFQFSGLDSGMPLYERVLGTIGSWAVQHPGIGAVVGATQRDFSTCIERVLQNGQSLPLLIPGVGAQGGSYSEIIRTLKDNGYKHGYVRINASSSISYAHERFTEVAFDEAADLAVDELTGSP
jgi:orotidine 5'-phosphate decarboxylase subfamily 2